MADQSSRIDPNSGASELPNQAANKEKAEGSRNLENAGNAKESGHASTGITNRPIEEETAEQEQLPRRGTSKEDDHA